MPLVTSTKTIQSTGYSGSAPFEWAGGGTAHPLAPFFRGVAYDAMYSSQQWPATAVNKLAGLQIMLPRQTRRDVGGDFEPTTDTPFARLLRRPTATTNPHVFFQWAFSIHHVHGVSFIEKVGAGPGRPPSALRHIHPTRMRYGPAGGGSVNPSADGFESSDNAWWVTRPNGREERIARERFIFWPRFSTAGPNSWMSPMEPLRETLESEAAIQRSNRAMWRNGGRHQIALTHPKVFNNPLVTTAIREQYASKYGGVDQHGMPLVLQEGMKVEAIPVQEELGYVGARQINRDEVAAHFDIPPPAIHILDRATFSNVAQQFGSIYRVTMPPHLTGFEAAIEFDLRDGSYGDGRPNFSEGEVFSFDLEGVLQGDFEARTDTLGTAVQTAQMTVNEARRASGRPPVPDGDVLLVNAALVPLSEASQETASEPDADTLPDDGTMIDQGVSTAGATEAATKRGLTRGEWSTLAGRLGRVTKAREVDGAHLVDGLDPPTAEAVLDSLLFAKAVDMDAAPYRQCLRTLEVNA